MNTKFWPLYESFRELLDDDHLWNLRAVLINRWKDGSLPQGRLTGLPIGPPLEAVILVYRNGDQVHLLAGYWRRKGEPTRVLLAAVEKTLATIRAA